MLENTFFMSAKLLLLQNFRNNKSQAASTPLQPLHDNLYLSRRASYLTILFQTAKSLHMRVNFRLIFESPTSTKTQNKLSLSLSLSLQNFKIMIDCLKYSPSIIQNSLQIYDLSLKWAAPQQSLEQLKFWALFHQRFLVLFV